MEDKSKLLQFDIYQLGLLNFHEGMMSRNLGLMDTAITSFRTAARMLADADQVTDSLLCYAVIADCYRLLGDYKAAEAAYQVCLKYQSSGKLRGKDLLQIRRQRCQMLADSGRVDEAKEELELVLEDLESGATYPLLWLKSEMANALLQTAELWVNDDPELTIRALTRSLACLEELSEADEHTACANLALGYAVFSKEHQSDLTYPLLWLNLYRQESWLDRYRQESAKLPPEEVLQFGMAAADLWEARMRLEMGEHDRASDLYSKAEKKLALMPRGLVDKIWNMTTVAESVAEMERRYTSRQSV